MAMNVGRGPKGLLAEINVTPMADVMIVLLIIFMVAVPILGRPPVPLPSAVHGKAGPEDEVKIVVDTAGAMTVGDLPVLSLTDITSALVAQGDTAAAHVRVEAARDADFATVGRVLEACRQAGVRDIALAVEARR